MQIKLKAVSAILESQLFFQFHLKQQQKTTLTLLVGVDLLFVFH